MFQRLILHGVKRSSLLAKETQCMYSATCTSTSAIPNDYLLEQVHIDEAVRIEPTLRGVTPELWRRTHETFINHGLYTSNFLRIVTGNPTIITRPPQKIVESLEYWRSCQFGEKLLHLLITKYPELLNISDGRQLLKRIAFLRTYVGTSRNIWKCLMNSPSLMEQSEKTIEGKMSYLQNTMRIEVPEIVKSEALSKPLDDIRCRHIFLERLGLFKPTPLKSNSILPSKNNRLYQITDTSEKTFATKVCHVTLDEYEAFKDLLAREWKRKEAKNDLNHDEYDDLSDQRVE